jgi:beta-N-acetylhexosaminidase
VIALGLIATGCSGSASSQAASTPAPSVSRVPLSPAPAASPSPVRSCATRVFDGMTEAQRVGQLFMAGMPVQGGPGTELTSAIRSHHLGSVLFAGNTTAGAAAVRSMTSAVQRLAGRNAGVRFFVAANQEGGQIQPLRGPGFSAMPAALAQGTMPVAELTRDARTWGSELAAAGVNLNLAPVLDVVPPGTASQNAPIGQLDREYGDEPGPVASHGVAFIDGMRDAGVATTAKHFPGLGRVRGNTDFTANVSDTITTANDPYLATYRAAVDAGVPFVMVALASYTRIDPGHLAVFSSKIVNGLLRRSMHFNGVIVSDDLGGAAAIAAIAPASRAISFLEAGGDMIASQTASAAVTMAEAVLRKASEDAWFRGVVSDAVMRILTVKGDYGLLPC